MRLLIVYCHPVEGSFGEAAVSQTVCPKGGFQVFTSTIGHPVQYCWERFWRGT